ncbi:M23 family metallopeptidase [Bradyrhizobium sp.]|jgi:murein DD-endopeptidase MepM/ murein hydrolase activator NlpD|uniref:M23 family metallopeptidase n=1 Tax=Bradyrhizobium sp. TaxID=376 RepID=UPI002DFDC114|nr:M23 family metallopeptidase [Bradyrhizobium sp.]
MRLLTLAASLVIASASMLINGNARAQSLPPNFASPPGDLETGSGNGRADATIYFPQMRFPLETGPAFANSQVYRAGGMHGPAGDQCASANYSYPWRDVYCEKRSWTMALCPAGKGHQGQDIRPATCKKDTHWAVAADDGVIANIGTYSVTLQTANGVLYRYLHLNIGDLAVDELDHVKKGARIGKVSNWFGDTSTTIHLHFDIKGTVQVNGKSVVTYLPPYTSLVASYKTLMSP